MVFKMLALRVLEGCSTEVRKNLKENETYLFDSGYKYDENKNYLVINNDVSGLPQKFYYKKNKKDSKLQYVNFQAVVGENGSGKSSLIELLLRILNNFFKQYRLNSTTDRLYFSKGVLAELYYLKGGSICKIFVDSRELKTKQYDDFKENDQQYIEIEFYENKKPKELIQNLSNTENLEGGVRKEEFLGLEQLFYSMYVNYSIYGIDPRDFSKEDLRLNSQEVKLKDYQNQISYDSWLDLIFHKNDGYQTPIVIHPYRDEGIINVRNEKRLLNQRMVSLLLTEANYTQLSESIRFHSLKVLSIKRTIIHDKIKNIFDDRTEDTPNYPSSSATTEELWLNNKFKSQSNSSRKLDAYERFDRLYRTYFDIAKRYDIVRESERSDGKYKFLFQQVIDYLYFNFKLDEEQICKREERGSVISDFLKKNGKEAEIGFLESFFRSLSFDQLQEVILVNHYYEFWLKQLNISSVENLNQFEKNLFEYVVVKSLKNIRYPKYDNLNSVANLRSFIANDFSLPEIVLGFHDRYLKQIEGDNSHIFFKLKQCIAFIKKDEDLAELKSIYEKLYYYKDNTSIIEIDRIRDEIINYKGELELLYLSLPPILETDIIVENENKVKESISKISSGEFQFISTISSIVYHLKNLDSVEKRMPRKYDSNEQYIYNYRNINIVLDEIELYFHPEFQRRFVSEIINKLQDISFKQIESISFILLTHSPFILSDIPSQHVLKLKEGVPVSHDLINSFGANIHDLLADEFFLKNGFMGEFAKNEINKVANYLNHKIVDNNIKDIKIKIEESNNSQEIDELIKKEKRLLKESKQLGPINTKYTREYSEAFIMQVGEPIIRMSLLELFNKAFKMESKKLLQEQINKLQKMLNDDSIT